MVVPLDGDVHRRLDAAAVEGAHLLQQQVPLGQLRMDQLREGLGGVVEPAVVAAGEDGHGVDGGGADGFGKGLRLKVNADAGNFLRGVEIQMDLAGRTELHGSTSFLQIEIGRGKWARWDAAADWLRGGSGVKKTPWTTRDSAAHGAHCQIRCGTFL